MTPEQIHQKILFGYGKAGTKLGATFNLYRSATPLTPISSGNLIGTIRMSSSVSWDYMKASKYGNAVFNACIDAQSKNSPNSARVGDYLIPTLNEQGKSTDNNRYYVGSLQFDLPPQLIKCNRTVSIIRPAETTGAGYQGYSAYLPSTSTTIMTAMPGSVLKGSRGEMAPSKLPTDTREPMWIILLPNLGDVIVRVGDIIRDDLQEEYVVIENELTELGWRIGAIQVINAG